MIEKKKILVVDDNRINRMILCKIIKAEGYETLEAENGEIAMDILLDKKSEILLVLLDILMPVMDGYQVLEKMSETGLLKIIPVIVTTGNEDDAAEIKCLECGASDFIRKPYKIEIVKHRIKSIIRLWDNATIINQIEIDRLTTLYTKEAFLRHAEEILDRNPNKKYMIVYLDVDEFKMINSRFGVAAGDELLSYFGDYFKTIVKKDGVAGRV